MLCVCLTIVSMVRLCGRTGRLFSECEGTQAPAGSVLWLIWKADLQRGGRFTERSSMWWLTSQIAAMARAGLVWNWEPRNFFWLSSSVQGPKDLDHLSLLSQAHGRELNQILNSWEMNWHPYSMLAPQGRGLMYYTMAPTSHEFFTGLQYKKLDSNHNCEQNKKHPLFTKCSFIGFLIPGRHNDRE